MEKLKKLGINVDDSGKLKLLSSASFESLEKFIRAYEDFTEALIGIKSQLNKAIELIEFLDKKSNALKLKSLNIKLMA